MLGRSREKKSQNVVLTIESARLISFGGVHEIRRELKTELNFDREHQNRLPTTRSCRTDIDIFLLKTIRLYLRLKKLLFCDT